MRIKPYVLYRLKAGHINLYNEKVKRIIFTVDSFLEVLAQSYRDLNVIRTSELQLIKLK
jgi:hypothetical protein